MAFSGEQALGVMFFMTFVYMFLVLIPFFEIIELNMLTIMLILFLSRYIYYFAERFLVHRAGRQNWFQQIGIYDSSSIVENRRLNNFFCDRIPLRVKRFFQFITLIYCETCGVVAFVITIILQLIISVIWFLCTAVIFLAYCINLLCFCVVFLILDWI